MEKQLAQLVLDRLMQTFTGIEAIIYDRRTGKALAGAIRVNPVEKACRLYLLGELCAELGGNLLDPRARSLMVAGAGQAFWVHALTEDEMLGVLLTSAADYEQVDAWVRNCIENMSGD